MNQKHKDYIFPKCTWVSKFEGKCSLLTARRLSPNPKRSWGGRGGGAERKKRKPSPQMVLDVVPNSKMLLGLPSVSNKIAGHPERPQGGERRLLSPLAPGSQQLCSVSAPQSPAVTGSLLSRLTGPCLASIFTPCRMPCLPPGIAGVSAPRGLGDPSACHRPPAL